MSAKSLGKWVPFIVAILAAGLYAMPMGRYVLKSVVNIFSFGFSDFKIFFIIVFYFITAVSWRRLPEKLSRSFFIAALFLTLACFALDQAEFFWLQTKLGMPIFKNEYTNFFGDGHLTSSKLTHTHNAKIALSLVCDGLFRLIPGLRIQGDFGLPLAHYYPKALAALHLVLILASMGAVFCSLRHVSSSLSRGWFAVYFIAAFVVIKNTMDGGLFNRETMFALPIFLAVLHRQIAPGKRSLLFLLTVYFTLCVALILPFRLMQVPHEIKRGLMQALLLWAIYKFIYACFETDTKNYLRKIGVSFTLAFLLVAVSGSSFSPASFLVSVPALTPMQFLNTDENLPLPEGFEPVSKDKAGEYYLYTVRNKEQQVASAIYQKLAKHIEYDRFAIHGISWDVNRTSVIWGTLLIQERGSFVDQEYFSEPFFDVRFKKIAEDRYFFYAKIKSGTAVFDPLFPYYLNGKGLKRFVFSRFGKLS